MPPASLRPKGEEPPQPRPSVPQGSLATDISCSVCLESMTVSENPCQLPCVHWTCAKCLIKAFPPGQYGLQCPVCRQDFPQYKLELNEEIAGGIAVLSSDHSQPVLTD